MPSTPPPSYSSTLQDNKQKKAVEFPYSCEIFACFNAALSLLICGFVLVCLLSVFMFRTCSPIERLEPCEFDGKLNFSRIFAIKKEINETKKKTDEITNVMNYGLSTEFSRTLLQKQNSINETLEKLLEEFYFQKRNFEKCYFDNYEIHHKKGTLFLRISSVLLSLIIIFCFLTMSFYIRRVPLSQLNEEEMESYKQVYCLIVCCFIFTLGILCIILTYVFVNNFQRYEEIDDIPIFVAETWKYKCGGPESGSRTAEEFVSQRSYDKNFHPKN